MWEASVKALIKTVGTFAYDENERLCDWSYLGVVIPQVTFVMVVL